MAGKKRSRRANGVKDAKGNNRRRKSGTGTLERYGEKWVAKYYIEENGIRKRKATTVTVDLVKKERMKRGLSTEGITDPIGIADARLVLATLSLDGARITALMHKQRLLADCNSIQAEREAAQKEREEAERKRIEAETDRKAIRIADAFPLYVQSKKRPDSGERTLDGYRAQYATFSEWCAKNHPDKPKMRDFTPEMAEAFIDHIERTRSRNTRNKYLVFLRTFWRVMRWNEDAQLSVDPWDGIKSIVQTPDEVKHKELTADELTRVANALLSPETNGIMSLTITPEDRRRNSFVVDIRGEMIMLFAIGIYTGLRLGDCACLDWRDIHTEKNVIDTMPRKTKRKYGRTVIIPIHRTLGSLLAHTPSEKRTGRVLPTLSDLYERNPSMLTSRIQNVYKAAGIDTGSKGARLYMKRGFYRIEYAERKPDGTHVIEKTPYSDLKKARAYFAEKMGTSQRARAEVGFHSLRHTFASIMLNAGAPFALVERMLGHSSESMTAHYFHENAQALAEAIAKLPVIAPLIPNGTDIKSVGFTAMPSDQPHTDEAASEDEQTRTPLDIFREAWDALSPDERKEAVAYIQRTDIA